MAGKLTAKQIRFVDEYLIDLNATQAAIRAEYSSKTAKEQAARLLSHVNVQAEIAKRQRARQRRTEITQDRVLQELAAIGFADIIDFAEVKRDVEGLPAVALKLTAAIPKEKRAAIAGIKQGANGVEVKMNDKLKALELIGKHLGMFDERKGAGECSSETFDDGFIDSLEGAALEVWASDEQNADVPI